MLEAEGVLQLLGASAVPDALKAHRRLAPKRPQTLKASPAPNALAKLDPPPRTCQLLSWAPTQASTRRQLPRSPRAQQAGEEWVCAKTAWHAPGSELGHTQAPAEPARAAAHSSERLAQHVQGEGPSQAEVRVPDSKREAKSRRLSLQIVEKTQLAEQTADTGRTPLEPLPRQPAALRQRAYLAAD